MAVREEIFEHENEHRQVRGIFKPDSLTLFLEYKKPFNGVAAKLLSLEFFNTIGQGYIVKVKEIILKANGEERNETELEVKVPVELYYFLKFTISDYERVIPKEPTLLGSLFVNLDWIVDHLKFYKSVPKVDIA